MRPKLVTRWIASMAGMLLLAACASPYSARQSVDARYGLSVADGVRLAAKAMLATGYFPTEQNDAAGRVVGERTRKDSFGVDVMTLYVEATVTLAPGGALDLKTTCSVSKNIAYTDELDDECRKFRTAFDKLLGEAAAPVRKPVPQKEVRTEPREFPQAPVLASRPPRRAPAAT